MTSKAHWDELLKAAHAKSQPLIADFGAPWWAGPRGLDCTGGSYEQQSSGDATVSVFS